MIPPALSVELFSTVEVPFSTEDLIREGLLRMLIAAEDTTRHVRNTPELEQIEFRVFLLGRQIDEVMRALSAQRWSDHVTHGRCRNERMTNFSSFVVDPDDGDV